MNHTLLTNLALQHAGIKAFTKVPMRVQKGGSAVSSSRWILAELLAPDPVLAVGFLSRNTLSLGGLKEKSKKTEKTLAQILACGNFTVHRSL
jgi:hypothetical protein